MKSNTSKKILSFIEKNGRATPKELIDYLGVTKQTVFKHLGRLLEDKIVFKSGKPPKVFYFINSESFINNQNWLVKKQSLLQEQVKNVLEKLNLIEKLSAFGEVRIVGSTALGLMTWPDINIDLESRTQINEKDYFKIIKTLFGQNNIKYVTLIDNRETTEKNRPTSMYIGIIYVLDGVKWKIDIRYLNSNNAFAGNNDNEIKSRLSLGKIKTILEIKTAFHSHPKYGKEFSGYDIYSAVLDKKISSVEEFENYLKENR